MQQLGTLIDYRIQKLDTLGFVWNVNSDNKLAENGSTSSSGGALDENAGETRGKVKARKMGGRKGKAKETAASAPDVTSNFVVRYITTFFVQLLLFKAQTLPLHCRQTQEVGSSVPTLSTMYELLIKMECERKQERETMEARISRLEQQLLLLTQQQSKGKKTKHGIELNHHGSLANVDPAQDLWTPFKFLRLFL